jgi:hypothetical protein
MPPGTPGSGNKSSAPGLGKKMEEDGPESQAGMGKNKVFQ